MNIKYYGSVFEPSGYGMAARNYVYALVEAGLDLSVVSIYPRRIVRDPLVESLLGRELSPDIHLFHHLPSTASRYALPLPETVICTVWETSQLPRSWYLNYAHDQPSERRFRLADAARS